MLSLEAATGVALGTAALGNADDIDAAVRAAREALDNGPWGRTTADERAAVMHRFAEALNARSESTSKLVSQETGMPSLMGATIVRREPVGVVGSITAWNYPLTLNIMKIAPALAAGCTVVLNPSPETALDSHILADAAIEAGLPAGVLNIVLGGREAGDIDTFVGGLGMASFMNNGQTCTNQTRILAPRSRYNEVVDAVAGFARDMVVGNPLDTSVTLGPMASEEHLGRVMSHIDRAKQSGARLVFGGNRSTDQNHGWFVEPTVFADVKNSDALAREEVFGPVMAVIPFDDDDDAVRIANDSNYGLGGYVWTKDEQRGIDLARRVRTGTIGVNYYAVDLGSPFGGMKDSGLGRELGP